MSIGNFVKRMRDIMRQDAGVNGDAQRIEQLTWMLFLKIYDDAESVWELMDDDFESIIPEALRWRNWAKGRCSHQLCQQHPVPQTAKPPTSAQLPTKKECRQIGV